MLLLSVQVVDIENINHPAPENIKCVGETTSTDKEGNMNAKLQDDPLI